MAGGEGRVAPGRGFLLLCILTLHFSSWNPVASADPSTTPPTMITVITPSVLETSPISSTSMVSNHSANGTEDTPLTCQSFQCSGERCYQDKAYANDTVTCHNESHCELYRLTHTNYTAKCSSECGRGNGTEMCVTNSSVSMSKCILECCNSSLCLQLNATAYGDLPPTTTPAPTTTTPKPPPKNGKVCTTFSCNGNGCFKGQKSAAECIVGFDFCEMKKTGSDYVAGCSKVCKTASPACARGAAASCYQECCQATPKTSCLKLDGNVHFNGAGQVALAPILKLLACGVGLVIHYSLSTFLQG
ncbi:uncharacterized protein LOC120389214 [Mauremys reevesii]|uniref:uncharacterized protein LOC120389214 n=1 Tax=Mauremys reevesii TaxID=260615 RepID=UPI00193ED5DB|nr:uncharacterized protein LOC120389214 [Mauremys reevesii]